jgi:FlaA1/EpsC-like NDP-sugar epimerase
MKKSWRIDAAYQLISLGSRAKIAIAASADAAVLLLSALLAVMLLKEPSEHIAPAVPFLVLGPLLVMLSLFATGAYKAVVRFIGMEFVERSALSVLLGAMLTYSACKVFGAFSTPANLVLLFGLFGFCLLLLLRMIAKRLLRPVLTKQGLTNVLIYGAGNAGTQLASALAINCQYRPVGFVDDESRLQGRVLLGLPVYRMSELPLLKSRQAFERVLLAIPSASRARQREILQVLEALAVKVLVMPGMEELASGSKQVDELREVQIEDLLERDPVSPVDSLLDLFIKDKAVMVTGAGGSIGSELCRQVVKQGARKIVLFEVCEYGLYKIERELRELPQASQCTIVPILNTVLDEAAMQRAMQWHRIETVYHAAAYKHVPLVESNVISAVRNNVFGTLNTVQSALKTGVQNFVLISTDKAVRPTNVMGASKRVCELIVQALAEQNPQVRMSMVRFGNVLASSGSVVPLFREQIKRGGPVTVTHREITRYFMTIPEAAQLVIQAGSIGHRGEVLVLDMGEPVRISELAQRMIHLSGLQVRDLKTGQGDIEIIYTGLRPGEKLYEELLIGENPEKTVHPRICKASEATLEWSALDSSLRSLEVALTHDAEQAIIEILLSLVTGFVRNPGGSTGTAALAPKEAVQVQSHLSLDSEKTYASPSHGALVH